VQEHLQKIGQAIYSLLQELQGAYAAEAPYQVLARLFAENFNPSTGSGQALVESRARPKENSEITSGCLQSVDDLEATYRTKGNAHYKGYVANLTETCDGENELQLITKVQVAPNNVDDSQLLAAALPDLQARTDLDSLITDGGFGGQASDQALQNQEVTHIQTAIRGLQPDPDKFSLSDFDLQQDEKGHPSLLTCPLGQTVPVTAGRTTGWQARFETTICATCPFQLDGRCRTQPQKRKPGYLLTFTTKQIRAAQRRKAYLAHQGNSHNLRSAVEATVRSVKHSFPSGKLPVRGQFRVTCMVIASAAVTNVRRIQRFLAAKSRTQRNTTSGQDQPQTPKVSFFAAIWQSLAGWLDPKQALAPTVDC
jgi:hypothetical protein